MPKLIQVGGWIFDPADVKAVNVGAPDKLTLHIIGCDPIDLSGRDAAAFLAYFANAHEAVVVSAGPLPIEWKPVDPTEGRAKTVMMDFPR